MIQRSNLIPKDLIIKPENKKTVQEKPAVQKTPEKKPFYHKEEKPEKNPGPGLGIIFTIIFMIIVVIGVFWWLGYQFQKQQKDLFRNNQSSL